MIQHIALTVNDSEEIERFYEEILLFKTERKFSINGNISKKIFDMDQATEVFVLGHQNDHFEVFISPQTEKRVFAHVCMAYWRAGILHERAAEAGYKTVVKENPGYNTYFIWDKSGNMFEIKDILDV